MNPIFIGPLLSRESCIHVCVETATGPQYTTPIPYSIHLIPKWPSFKYAFVCLQISPYGLVLKKI